MSSTIFAAFKEPADAEKAAGALLDNGLHEDEISLIANERYNNGRNCVPPSVVVPKEESPDSHLRNDVENNEVMGSSYGRSVVYEGEPMVQRQEWGEPGSNMAYGTEMAGGIESTDPATHYPAGHEAIDDDEGAPTMPHDAFNDQVESAKRIQPPEICDPVGRPELHAKSGISTTTADDAEVGAIKGAAVGLSVGAFALALSLLIPGFGIVMGGGALATALAGMVGTIGAGAVAGAVVGYLKDQGVPEEAITVYRNTFDKGGAILAVAVPTEFNRADIEAILAKYGATNVDMYGDVRA